MDLDLAQVRAFVAAARHGSMSGAAVELFLTQQALSKRIRRLEDRLGPLLVRRSDGVEPTAAGRRFLPAAQRLLDAADAALAAARDTPAGPLRVDVWGHLHEPLRLVRRYTDRHPEAPVELSMRRNLVQAVAAVRRRELDVALGNVTGLPGGLPAGLRARPVTLTPLMALVNPAGPLGARTVLDAAALAATGLWMPFEASSPELSAFVTGYAAALGVPVRTGGVNLGADVLVSGIAARPGDVSLYDSRWGLPDDDRVRLVPLRPVPLFPWFAAFAADAPAHPGRDALVEFLAAHGRWEPGDGWLPQPAVVAAAG